MKIVLSIILMMFLSGCCSTKLENTDDPIFHFIDKYIPKLSEYVLKDEKLSERDKNTYIIMEKEFINELNKKFNHKND